MAYWYQYRIMLYDNIFYNFTKCKTIKERAKLRVLKSEAQGFKGRNALYYYKIDNNNNIYKYRSIYIIKYGK